MSGRDRLAIRAWSTRRLLSAGSKEFKEDPLARSDGTIESFRGRGRGRSSGSEPPSLMRRVGAIVERTSGGDRVRDAKEGTRRILERDRERFSPSKETERDVGPSWNDDAIDHDEKAAVRKRWAHKQQGKNVDKERIGSASTKRRETSSKRSTESPSWYAESAETNRRGSRIRRDAHRKESPRPAQVPEGEFAEVDVQRMRRFWDLELNPSLQMNLELDPPRFSTGEDVLTEEEEEKRRQDLDRAFLAEHEEELRRLCNSMEDTVLWEKDKIKALANLAQSRRKARIRDIKEGGSGWNDVQREERALHALIEDIPQDHAGRNIALVAVKTLCGNPDWKFQQKKEFLTKLVEELQEDVDPKFNIFDL